MKSRMASSWMPSTTPRSRSRPRISSADTSAPPRPGGETVMKAFISCSPMSTVTEAWALGL